MAIITKSRLRWALAMVLLSFEVLGLLAIVSNEMVVHAARHQPASFWKILLHFLWSGRRVDLVVFSLVLWLLVEKPIIALPCAAIVTFAGLWLIWDGWRDIPVSGVEIFFGVLLCWPAAIEVWQFYRIRRGDEIDPSSR